MYVHGVRVNRYAYIRTSISIYIWSSPYDTQTPSKKSKNQCETCFFCLSDFGSFSDAEFVSNNKTGKAKDPRIQKSHNLTIQKSKNPKSQICLQDSVDVTRFGFLDFIGFYLCGFLDFIGFYLCGFLEFLVFIVLEFWDVWIFGILEFCIC